MVEIFASKAENVQIFFTDFFKIYDVYNRPGTSGDENWSLRVPNNFKDIVYKYHHKQLTIIEAINILNMKRSTFLKYSRFYK